MKRFQKVLALSLTLVMLLALASCGEKPAETTPPPAESGETPPAAFALERQANMYIAYKAGGGSDRMFRAFQPYLEESIGQTLNPVYLPGAEGLIGWTSLLSTPPDGYNIGVLNIPSATASIVSGEASFDVDSFEYLGNITYEPPLLIIAKGNSWGIETMDDLIAYAKANPGKVTIAHTGTGGDEYIAIRLLAQKAGIDVKDVPFEDTASSAAAVMGGHVFCAMTSAYGVLNYLEQEQVIGLAMGSDEREPAFDQIPIFLEYDIDLVLGGMRGIVAPKGMTQEQIDFWVNAIHEMVENPEYQAYAAENGTMLRYMDPEEFKAAHQNLYEEYSAMYATEPW